MFTLMAQANRADMNVTVPVPTCAHMKYTPNFTRSLPRNVIAAKLDNETAMHCRNVNDVLDTINTKYDLLIQGSLTFLSSTFVSSLEFAKKHFKMKIFSTVKARVHISNLNFVASLSIPVTRIVYQHIRIRFIF